MWEEVVTVAEKMRTYEELQAELETYKTKYEAYKAENNALKHDRVNRQAKGLSIFESICQKRISAGTLQRTVSGRYNDYRG